MNYCKNFTAVSLKTSVVDFRAFKCVLPLYVLLYLVLFVVAITKNSKIYRITGDTYEHIISLVLNLNNIRDYYIPKY